MPLKMTCVYWVSCVHTNWLIERRQWVDNWINGFSKRWRRRQQRQMILHWRRDLFVVSDAIWCWLSVPGDSSVETGTGASVDVDCFSSSNCIRRLARITGILVTLVASDRKRHLLNECDHINYFLSHHLTKWSRRWMWCTYTQAAAIVAVGLHWQINRSVN